MAGESQTDKPEFRLDTFEGPLDLLLFLIKKSEINIYDIPIATITEQYLEYLNYSTKIQRKWESELPDVIGRADRNWPELRERD
mgnify:CR=1 FL=1